MFVTSKKQKRNSNSEGQALVLVLLALAVVLTIVLYILSRSITDISTSSSESSSVGAFSAAEAGVEQALITGTSVGSQTIGPPSCATQPTGCASYSSQVTQVAKGATNFTFPVQLNSGDNMTLWLKSQDATADFTGSNVKICWGKVGTDPASDTTPAIETVLFYETVAGDPSTAQVFRAAYDPNAASRDPSNSFTPASLSNCTIAGQTYPFSATVNIAGYPNPQFMFVRMFYNTDTTQPVAFDSTDAHSFPTQGIIVDSSGSSANSNRRVTVFQGWPEIPLPFEFAVYSSAGLSK